MGRRYLGLRAEQVGRADLHGAGTQGQCCNQAAVVSDAASGDHRQVNRIGNLWHQGEGADLAVDVFAEEHAAMATGFKAHGNDRVATLGLQP
ncbi:hypothetical protein D3C79_673880 [compost metagenome]